MVATVPMVRARARRRGSRRESACATRRAPPAVPRRGEALAGARSSARLWSTVLPKPMPGIDHDLLLAESPRRARTPCALRGSAAPRPRHRRSADRPAWSWARPLMCIRQTGQPASAITSAMSGSKRSALTSLMSAAPAARARRATSAFIVSTEIGTPTRPARASTTGRTRRSSSSSDTGSEPGPRGLAADVDERRALAHQGEALRERVVGGEEAAAVGERVGGDVEHAHDAREGEVERSRSAGPAWRSRSARRVDEGEGLGAGGVVRLDEAAHGARHGPRPRSAHASHGHAEMLGLDEHERAERDRGRARWRRPPRT